MFMKTLARNTGSASYETGLAARSAVEDLAVYTPPGSLTEALPQSGLPDRGKPRVLILPNVASWIVGQMAMHIMRRFQDEYEFWILTDKMIRLRPDLVRTLIPELDFIFPLTDKSYKLLRAACGNDEAAAVHILAASCDHMEPIHAGGCPGCRRTDCLHAGMAITN